jgi:hypothetical protein
MKGPSLKRQYDTLQAEINERVENYKKKRTDHQFPEIKEGIIQSIQSFDVQEQPYECSDYPGVGSCTVMPVRYSRWQFYALDEEKLKKCETMQPKQLNCKECQLCGLWDVDGHYKIPCCNIMKIGIDIY